MIAPRWRKALRDLSERPLRTALAVGAMAAGVFGVGMILTSWSILTRELKTTYSDTRPASAILVLDGSDVSDALVDAVRHMPGVRDAEARPVIGGRLRVGPDQWVPLTLFVVHDFRDVRLDRFTADAGANAPAKDEVLIERSSLSVARSAIGDRVIVRTSDGNERALRIAGTVHAAGLAPGWMEHGVTGFVSARSVLRTGARAESAQLRILVAGDRLDERHIREVASRVSDSLAASGRKVTRVEVPTPGRHPHAAQMDTFLLLLGTFGALTFALSAVLVANMIHALLTEQVRQAGVMKTLGASTRQIAALYLGQVLLLALAALAIGIPLGLMAGRAYAAFCASMLNATIRDATPPFWIFASEAAAGILIPLLVALGPVVHASRISIHEAFSNDAGRRPFGTRAFDRWLARRAWLSRPLMLSLRATFHRRGRLVLTVATLAVGGGAFIAALNVSAAWTRTLAADAAARRFDVQAVFPRPYPIGDVARALGSVPDVVHAEYWTEAGASMANPAVVGEPRVSLTGPPLDSKLLVLPLIAGRWLKPGDRDVAVINQSVASRDPSLRVGGDIPLRVNGTVVRWRIVGLVKELAPHAAVYAPSQTILRATGQSPDRTRSARIVTRRHDVAGQVAASKAIERALESSGIDVSGIQALSDARKSFSDHLVIIKSALMFAALLVVLVGGLGLTTTLTLNVFERTREIGILSAIGATPRTIAGDVLFEGLVIAGLSWVAAVLVAIPITFALDAATGQMFIQSPLDFFLSPAAVAAWLLLVLVLAALSSFIPARRSARLAVREALAYE